MNQTSRILTKRKLEKRQKSTVEWPKLKTVASPTNIVCEKLFIYKMQRRPWHAGAELKLIISWRLGVLNLKFNFTNTNLCANLQP